MADVVISADYSDLKALNEWLNITDQKVKVLTKTAQNSFSTFKKQQQEFENVKRSIDPLYNATVAFEKKLEILNRSFEDKSSAEYARNLDLLRKQAQRAGLVIDNANKVVAMSSKSTRQMEIGFQQAGYQIQDFIVQVQGGTNPLIAFSQQGSQLAGFFAGPWGAAIGLAIAGLSSLAMGILATSGEMKTLKDSLTDVEETNDILKDFGKDFGRNFIGQIELVRNSFGNLVADIYEAQIKQLQSTLSKEFSRGYFAESFARSFTAIKPSSLSAFDQEGLNRQAQQELEIQSIINNLINARVSSQSELAKLYSEAYDRLKASNSVSEEGLKYFRERGIELGLHSTIMQEIADTQSGITDAVDDEAEARKKIAEYQNDLLWKLDEQTAKLLDAQGLEEQALALRKQAAYEQAYADVMSKAASEEQKANLIASAALAGDVAQEAVQVAYETEKARDAARGFADNLRDAASSMSALTSLGSSIERALAVSEAKVSALKTKADETVAGTIAGYRFDIKAKTDQAMADAARAGQPVTAIIEASAKQLDMVAELEKSLTTGSKIRESNKGGGRSKTTDPIKSGTEYIERVLKPELELRNKTVMMSDEQQKRYKFEFDLRQKLDKYKEKASEKEINAAMALYDQAVKLEKIAGLMQYAEGQFEDFFMTVVDGTTSIGDAFKGMLRNILLEIYKQQVAKPLASGIGNLLGKGLFGGNLFNFASWNANGNAFRGGSVIPFANGGVVGGPTTFPMSSGRTGLMGEAGPEAIMPLKRGANGKLGVQVDGSQGNVVVQQTFNFSANGDESVKKIIAQAAPKIAQMTQKQIMDSRKRGGQMKAAFS